MTLRKKIFLIVALTFVGLASVLAVSAYHILLKGMQEIEVEDARNNLDGALSLLNQELGAMDTTARDYASWNDMYAFIKTGDKAFIASNFVPSTFSNLKINFMIISDCAGNIAYAKGFDLHTLKTRPAFKSILDHRKGIHNLVFSAGTAKPLMGIISLPEGFSLMVARPILTSDGKGKPRGLFIIGRFLDENEITRLGKPLNLQLSLFHKEQINTPLDVESAWKSLTPEQRVFIKPIDGLTIAGYALIEDAFGKYSLMVRINDKRTIFQQGMTTIIYVISFVIFAALVFTFMMLIILEKSVLRRILRISEDIKAIEGESDVSRRIHLDGSDEIASLSNDINNMLCKLEISENRIRSEAEKYRAVIEDQTEFICRFGEDGVLNFVNDAYYRFFSHNRRAMIGRHFLSFVPDEDRRRISELLATFTVESPTASYEIRVVFPDGEEFWQHWTCRAIFDDKGNLLEYQAVGRDITDRKRTESELLTLNKKLEEANVQLGLAYANLKNNLDNLRKHLFKEEFAILVERDGMICAISERVFEYLKLSRNQIIGAYIGDFLSTTEGGNLNKILRDAWIGITTQSYIKLIRSQGESESQLFEIKLTRITLKGKRLLLVTLR